MAQDNFISPILAPDLQARQNQNQLRQMYAQQLLQSGQEVPQGQMVSGHFVAPAWSQYLAQGLKSYLGGKGLRDAATERDRIAADTGTYWGRQFGIGGQPDVGTSMADGRGPTNANAQRLGQALAGGSAMPLLPGRNNVESYRVFQGVGAPEYFKMVAQQNAPTAVQQNLTAAGLQPGTPEYQKALLENINPSQKPTGLMLNLASAGLQPGTPEYRDAILKGTRGTTVNVGAGEKAWDTESAKLFAKRYDDLTTQAQSAQQMLGLYDLAQAGLDSGVRTGSLGGAEQAVRQMGLALGIGNADKIAGGELLTAVQNRMALQMRSPDSGMGMPGAVSDRDLTFLKEAQIGLDRTPAGNRQMLDAFRKLEQRKVQVAQLADQYIQKNGRLDAGFNQAVRKYADENPLFPRKEDNRDQQLTDILGF